VVTRSKTCALAWKTCLRFSDLVAGMMMRNLIEYYYYYTFPRLCSQSYTSISTSKLFLRVQRLATLSNACSQLKDHGLLMITESMSEQPASIARYKRLIYSSPKVTHDRFCFLLFMSSVVLREARSIHQSLKELLKTKEPFDKEVDFQRKK